MFFRLIAARQHRQKTLPSVTVLPQSHFIWCIRFFNNVVILFPVTIILLFRPNSS